MNIYQTNYDNKIKKKAPIIIPRQLVPDNEDSHTDSGVLPSSTLISGVANFKDVDPIPFIPSEVEDSIPLAKPGNALNQGWYDSDKVVHETNIDASLNVVYLGLASSWVPLSKALKSFPDNWVDIKEVITGLLIDASHFNTTSNLLPTIIKDNYPTSGLFEESSDDAIIVIDYELLTEEIYTLFSESIGTAFQDGIYSKFSTELCKLIENYGNELIHTLRELIITNKLDLELISESLRWIGDIDDDMTKDERLKLLTFCLKHESLIVRDGAMIGLDIMGDSISISYIRDAMEKEDNSFLKKYMSEVLKDLENS